MIRALKDQGPQTPVLDVMQEAPTIAARSMLEAGLKLLTESRAPVIGVAEPNGRLTGLLTLENVGEMMMLRAARPEPTFGPWRRQARRV
jgi:hypothetical protein